ncbi:MAG: hypothetical protein ABI743_08805 [bacterium]
MQRYTILASILGLTALVAWGCSGSAQQGPLTPDGGTPRDISTDPGGGNGDPGSPTDPPGSPVDNTAGPVTDSTSVDSPSRNHVTRDCDGKITSIPDGNAGFLGNLPSDGADATNLADPVPVSYVKGRETGTVTFTKGEWSKPARNDDGSMSVDFAFQGDGDLGAGGTFAYTTILHVDYNFYTTCIAINKITVQHTGYGPSLNENWVFGEPLRISHNAWVPEAGETYSATTLDPVNGVGQWTAGISSISHVDDDTWTVINLDRKRVGVADMPFSIVWSKNFGPVLVSDPFLTETGPFGYHFPDGRN